MTVERVPDWLQSEFVRAALAGETCLLCGSPRWLCIGVGSMVHGLTLLQGAPASAETAAAITYLAVLVTGEGRWPTWCWVDGSQGFRFVNGTRCWAERALDPDVAEYQSLCRQFGHV